MELSRIDPFSGTALRAVERLRGGSGATVTYRVERPSDGKHFVAKLLRTRDVQLAERMRVEYEVLRELRHRHIVAVEGFGATKDGRPFLLMELLCGTTVEDEFRRRAIKLEEALRWTLALLSALEEAHRHRVIHRDLHLGNLFLVPVGRAGFLLKVLDFGLAKPLGGANVRRVRPPTGKTTLLGSFRFTSPEAASSAVVDEKSDLYSAGLVLHALLTGHPPFGDLVSVEVPEAHLSRALPAPSEFRSDIPLELDAIVKRATAKNPDERFHDAREFRNALRRVRLRGRWSHTRIFSKE